MEYGKTVVLINSESINTNFYDVLNKHYMELKKNDDDGNEIIKYFANVAIGALSRLCVVHKDFKIIIHLPIKDLSRAPAPFLNRFEKYVLGFNQIYEEKILFRKSNNSNNIYNILDYIKEGCEDFVSKIGEGVFFGYDK
jgi:hypothetical protein